VDAEDSPEVLRAGTGTLKRTGAWRVPSKLQVMSATGAVKLDFRDAVLNGGHVDIEVQSGTGAVDSASSDLLLPALVPAAGSLASLERATDAPSGGYVRAAVALCTKE
jgi:hypothetical protein